MTSEIERLLGEADLNQTELAGALGVDSSTISRKIAGSRPWKLVEIQEIIRVLSARLNRTVTYEEVCGSPAEARS